MTRIRIRKMNSIPAVVACAMFISLVVCASPGEVGAAGDIVPATECTAPELTQSELVAIVAVASTPAPAAETTSSGSELTDDTLVQAVTDVVRLSVACANANAPLRSLSLFSERYLQHRFGAEPQDDLGHLIASMSRTPGPVEVGDLLSLDSVSLVSRLPDGRVSVIVTTSNAREVFVDTLLLVEVEGTWLIDEVSPGINQGTPTPTT